MAEVLGIIKSTGEEITLTESFLKFDVDAITGKRVEQRFHAGIVRHMTGNDVIHCKVEDVRIFMINGRPVNSDRWTKTVRK